MGVSRDPLVRFNEKVERIPFSDCWFWIGGTYKNGYGEFLLGGKVTPAHRASYRLHVSEIPIGFVVMHSCDNKLCVNPQHLSIGTQMDNVSDCVSKGRAWYQTSPEASKACLNAARKRVKPRFGSRNPVSKIDCDAASKILKLVAAGHKQRDIAKLFGVSKSTIGNVARGETWVAANHSSTQPGAPDGIIPKDIAVATP